MKKLIGMVLSVLGIGLIGYGIGVLTHTADIPKWMPKAKSAEQREWEFPEN